MGLTCPVNPGKLAPEPMWLTTVLALLSPGQEGSTNPVHTSHQEGMSFLPLPFPPLPSAYPPVRCRSLLCGTHEAHASGPRWGALRSCWRKETEHGLASLALQIMSTNLALMKCANLQHLVLSAKRRTSFLLVKHSRASSIYWTPSWEEYLTYHFTYSLSQVWNGGGISLVFKMRGLHWG